jgi:hypothetical protein
MGFLVVVLGREHPFFWYSMESLHIERDPLFADGLPFLTDHDLKGSAQSLEDDDLAFEPVNGDAVADIGQ